MKYKIIVLFMTFCLIFIGISLSVVDKENGQFRYQQHLKQPSEKELGVCNICQGKSELCTHLPIIRIDTNGQKIPGKPIYDKSGSIIEYEKDEYGKDKILVSLETIDEEGVYHHLTDKPTETLNALFHIRGNTSRNFSKHNFSVELINKNNIEDSVSKSLLGMHSGKKWVLHGPFLDKTLIRNYLCMNIAGQIMQNVPDVRFCELILDGKYQGVYLLMESIDVQEGRVEITEQKHGSKITSYIVSIEPNGSIEKTVNNFTKYTKRMEESSRLEIKYPTSSKITPEIKNAIGEDFSYVERMLYSYSMADGSFNYKKYIDLDSFVDYYILNEFTALNDMFYASTYFTKDARGRIQMGPVWDYNNAFDNYKHPFESSGFLLSQRGWYGELMKDPEFVECVVNRYKQLRKGVLSEQYLKKYISDTITWLGSSIKRNYSVWGYTFSPDNLNIFELRRPAIYNKNYTIYDINPSSFEESVKYLVKFMDERGRWLDRNINSLYQYCQRSKKSAQIME